MRGPGSGVVVELALRALLTAALLNFVHGRAPAVQGNNLTSQDQPIVSEVNAVIRQVLADRIAAKDIPDYGLLRGTQRIAVRSDGLGTRLTRRPVTAKDEEIQINPRSRSAKLRVLKIGSDHVRK